MRAAVVHEFERPLSVEEVPKPEPGPGEVVVKIEASGLCHTDIHAAHGDWPVKPKLPLIPGHEGVGIVEDVGPGVTEVREGERVAIPWLGYACGACEYCASGRETLCEHQLNTGYFLEVLGGFLLRPWWRSLALGVVLLSLVITILGWPGSWFGILVNLAILAYLFVEGRRGWLPRSGGGTK